MHKTSANVIKVLSQQIDFYLNKNVFVVDAEEIIKNSICTLYFKISNYLHLSIAFNVRGCILICIEKSIKHTYISSSLRSLIKFLTNKISAQALILDGDWYINKNDMLAMEFESVESEIMTFERHLLPLFMPEEAIRDRTVKSACNLGDIHYIDRIGKVSEKEFINCYSDIGKPVVISNTIDVCKSNCWSLNGLAIFYNKKNAYASNYPPFSYSIHTYLDKIKHNEPLSFKIVLPLNREIRKIYNTPGYFRKNQFFNKARGLIIAPADSNLPKKASATTWHCDLADNFLLQVWGRKIVQLSSPIYKDCLYTKTAEATHCNVAIDYSLVDHKNINNKLYPLFKTAKIIECILEPGDLLYLPAGWYHNVINPEATCSINCWMIDPPVLAVNKR